MSQPVSSFTEQLVQERVQIFNNWIAELAMSHIPPNITGMDIQFRVTYDDGVVSDVGMRLDSAGWEKEIEQ